VIRVRGVALASPMRGRAARRRMLDRGRGADGGQLLHGIEQGVAVVPVLNRSISVGRAGPVIEEMRISSASGGTTALRCSAKTGAGVDDIFSRRSSRHFRAAGVIRSALQALIIDSWFDNYVGVVMLVRVMQGTLKPRDKILA